MKDCYSFFVYIYLSFFLEEKCKNMKIFWKKFIFLLEAIYILNWRLSIILAYFYIKEEYRIACRLKDISIGHPSYHAIGEDDDRRIVCNFPTMYYPGSITKKEDIELGLLQLHKDLTFPDSVIYNKSIAFCALGCGIGRFSYNELKNLIFTIFEEYDNLIELYKPLNIYN